jgi:hypothetical protein
MKPPLTGEPPVPISDSERLGVPCARLWLYASRIRIMSPAVGIAPIPPPPGGPKFAGWLISACASAECGICPPSGSPSGCVW